MVSFDPISILTLYDRIASPAEKVVEHTPSSRTLLAHDEILASQLGL